jgi:hypothetical protein
VPAPAPSTIDTLGDYAVELLQVCEAAIAKTDAGPIDRAFISPGNPALDCPEQLTVNLSSIAYDTTQPTIPPPAPGHRSAKRFGSLILATYKITAVRCIPVGRGPNVNLYQPPTPAEQQAAALSIVQAAWSCWNDITNAVAAGTIFGGPCKAVYLDALAPLEPSGGSAGWTLQVRAAIDGYPEVGS